MSDASERHRENKEAKEAAKRRWEQETEELQKYEANKPKLRKDRSINTVEYTGPETNRLENKNI